MRVRSDTTPLRELPPELRLRVRAAAGHATEVHVIPEGTGYRISALSGDTAVEMYLEMRPDGSVEERTHTTTVPKGHCGENGDW
jgi:hypothetical protein